MLQNVARSFYKTSGDSFTHHLFKLHLFFKRKAQHNRWVVGRIAGWVVRWLVALLITRLIGWVVDWLVANPVEK